MPPFVPRVTSCHARNVICLFLFRQFIVGCLIGVLLWILVTCLLWTPVYAITALKVRGTQLNMTTVDHHDLSYYGEVENSSQSFDMQLHEVLGCLFLSGMYGTHGQGVRLSEKNFQFKFEKLIACFSICLTGCVLVIMGFVSLNLNDFVTNFSYSL